MISVIVPVYNVEQYLPYCLNSISGQTYKDYEVILVDDGSTDSSVLICDEFCKSHFKFRTIHQKNKGLAEARNTGLSEIKGDYYSFIDSDDYIHPQMLELLMNACLKTNCDIAMSNIEETDESGVYHDIFINEPRIINQERMIYSVFNDVGKYLYHVVWNKLYKAKLKTIRFNNVENEDTDYNIRVYLTINKLAFIDAPLYYYYQRQGSIVRNHHYKSFNQIDVVPHYLAYLSYIPKEKRLYRAFCLSRTIKKYLSAVYNTKDTPVEEYANKKLYGINSILIKELSINKAFPFIESFCLKMFLKRPLLYSIFRRILEIGTKMSSKIR